MIFNSKFVDPKVDIVFKKIFGKNPDLLISFLNGILPLKKDQEIKSIEYLPTEQVPEAIGVKNTIADIKCYDQNNNIFIVEIQLKLEHHFEQRLVFGASRAFTNQLDIGKDYDKLYPVYAVAILNYYFDKSAKDWFHHFQYRTASNKPKILKWMHLIFIELPKFKPQSLLDRKMGVLWLRFLKEVKAGTESVSDDLTDNPLIMKALQLSQQSSLTRGEMDWYEKFLDAQRLRRADMKYALEEGEKKGIEKGIEKGKEEGAKEQSILIALNLLKRGIAAQEIAEITGLTIDEINRM